MKAHAMRLVHRHKLNAELEAPDPADDRLRHTHGQINIREEEAQLERISYGDSHKAFH